MNKIVTVVGARPQFIKMPLVSGELKRLGIKEVIVNTGQHYDRKMSGVFFSELKLPKPAYDLGVGPASSREAQVAEMTDGISNVIAKERPALVLVYGDTNSTLAGAIAAIKSGVRIAHIEAGLRSFNTAMTEEMNRVITDSVSSIFFCPTRASVANLKKEGKAKDVYLVGDVMFDSIKHFTRNIKRSPVCGKYSLCTIHRAESTDSPVKLRKIFAQLGGLKEDIILPLHPRTAKCIQKYGIKTADNISVIEPVGYLDMLALEKNAHMIITDSGGVQKEAAIFGVPCVTLRDETEWVETVASGRNFLAGSDARRLKAMAGKASRAGRKKGIVKGYYGDGRAYKKIASIISKKLKEWKA